MKVCFLLNLSQEVTWGIAYRVSSNAVPEVIAYLDHREKCGYSTHSVTFHPSDNQTIPFPVLVYIATERNSEFLGPAPLDTLARHVAGSRGPSGCNTEYVLNLARAMREIAPHTKDEHLFSLEDKLRELLASTDNHSTCSHCEHRSS